MAIAGKVAITPKGEWNANTTYEKLDLVFYENASYVATKPSTGVLPTDESYWMLVVQSAGGADLEAIIDGTTQVGNALTLDGHGAEYFAKETDLANYLPLTGGTVSGDVTVLKDSGSACVRAKTATKGAEIALEATQDGKVGLYDYKNKKWLIHLALDGTIKGSDANSYDATFLHTGNKPTGTYTGNGDATRRAIKTNSTISKGVLVLSEIGMVVLTYYGAICKKATETSVVGLSWTEANVVESNGEIVLKTVNEFLNANGVTYTYYSL